MSGVAEPTRAGPALTVTVADHPSPDWDPFVMRDAAAPIYLRSGWSQIAREVFRHNAYFLEARDEGECLVGVLPLVQQRSLLGNFMTSVPFYNYGGALAADEDIARTLMERAQVLARDLGCSYLELRDVRPRCDGWVIRTDKVTMIRPLPTSPEILAKELGSKLRSQIKRADREVSRVAVGGAELLGAFYDVFCRNMRDLGTPVYPERFFRAILERFPDNALIVLVECRGEPSAAGFMVVQGTRAEIPWASCRKEAKPLGANMRLYWEVLTAAISRGCSTFDFGRSTADSGTYRFKQQWGAQPRQLHWHRWQRGSPKHGGDSARAGALMSYAVAAWQRLPLPVANAIGPLISPALPW